jgi:hypothetical protein
MTKKTSSKSSVVKIPSRDIKPQTTLLLYVVAGGRCEFEGCNKYVVRHPLTHDYGNYGQRAHIVAFKKGGTRGDEGDRPEDINSLDNLMLLCPPCHHLVDKVKPQDYPRELLEKYKREHEERIFWQTEAKPDYKTTVVQFKALINGHMVDIPVPNVKAAVASSRRYMTDPRGYLIDLTGIKGDGAAFYLAARESIKISVAKLYEGGMDLEKTQHISLFALAPMPLLIYLGNQLSNKIAVDAFQRHRDTDDWVWKTSGDPVGHEFKTVREGTDKTKVALLFSLSGTLGLEKLPPVITPDFYVYEITVATGVPNPMYLRLKADLEDFRHLYRRTLRVIESAHPALTEIHFFPACPAPVAVYIGLDVLPKIDPALIVYDNDKAKGGFNFVFEVNGEKL